MIDLERLNGYIDTKLEMNDRMSIGCIIVNEANGEREKVLKNISKRKAVFIDLKKEKAAYALLKLVKSVEDEAELVFINVDGLLSRNFLTQLDQLNHGVLSGIIPGLDGFVEINNEKTNIILIANSDEFSDIPGILFTSVCRLSKLTN